MVHSEEDYNAAVEASNILFGNATADALHKLDEETFLQVFEGVEHYEIPRSELAAGIQPLELLAEKTQIFPSKGEARKMIQANGFSLNKEKLTDAQTPLTTANLLNDKYLLFQKGKKNYYLVTCTD
jgi:tyrosyl-tRNA synthetase